MEPLMTALAMSLDRADAESRVRAWIDTHAFAWETNLVLSGGLAHFTSEEGEQMGPAQARELDDLFRVVADMTVRPSLKKTARAALTGRDTTALEALEPIVSSAMQTIAPDLERTSPDGRFLARTILRGLATLLDEQAAIEGGELTPIPRTFSGDSSRKVRVKLDASPFLSNWPEFETSKTVANEWKADTASNARSTCKLFRGLIGDKPAASISRKDVSAFRRELFRLPSLYDKAVDWRDLPLSVIIDLAAAKDETAKAAGQPLIRRLKLRTVDKHLSNLLEYWKWCTTNGHIQKDLENPFTGFIQPKPKGRKARLERNTWPQAMLETLFGSPVWAGCKNVHRRKEPGPHVFRDARFWVPLWGFLIGAREDEICSRLVGDIDFIDGIAVLKIRDSKTFESDRDIPIPETLLRMGFLEYRYWGRSSEEPLFPELIPQGIGGRRSAAFSGWFTEYRKGVGCYALLVDFHSFRHNVSTTLQNLPGLNPGWADEITGHDSIVRASERARYAKGVYMRHLKQTLDRIETGVNLDHLTYQGIVGEPAVGAAEERATFVALAVRDMKNKATPRKKSPTHAG